MKFTLALMIASAAVVFAAPVDEFSAIAERNDINRRTSCQICSIKGLEAGPACCSLSCIIQHGDIHGGHCNANDVCVCN